MLKTYTKLKVPAVLFVTCFLSVTANAQITLTTNNVPHIGDVWANRTITDTTIQPGPVGPNVTWDFTNFQVTVNVRQENYVSIDSTPYAADFPGANMAVNSYLGGFDFFDRSAADLKWKGWESSTNRINISNTQQVFSVPLTYNGSVTNTQAVSGTHHQTGAPITGTISAIADGYGTLKLQTGDFTDVLRVTLTVDLLADLGSGLTQSFKIIKYNWYRNGLRAPLFQIIDYKTEGIVENAKAKFVNVSTVTSSIQESTKLPFTFGLYPNPAKDIISISMQLTRQADIQISVLDITGKILKDQTYIATPGINEFLLNLGSLPRGIYMIAVQSGSLVSKKRIVLE